METNNEVQVFQSISTLIQTNDETISEKSERAIAALSAIKVISTPEDDAAANNILVKCNNTLKTIEDLRKEYTGKLDEWKKTKMERETKLKNEMDRVKRERDAYKAREAAQANSKRIEIENKQKHDQHYAECKTELVASIELGIANRITKGEEAISRLFEAATLETVDQLNDRLSKEPSLDAALLESWISDFDKVNPDPQITWRVDYNIVTKEEIDELKDRARKHPKFQHAAIQAKYIELVKEIQSKWKGKIPERKKYLTDLAKANAEEAVKLKAQQAEAKKNADAEIARKAAEEKEAIEKKRSESNTEATIQTTFAAQVETQSIAEQDGTRKKIVYRFADEDKIINNPLEFVSIMSNVMAHVVTDREYLGPFKRKKMQGDKTATFIEKDPKTGLPVYLDMVQMWLDWIASIKPSPEIPGLTKTEVISSVARKQKEEM